MHVLMTAIGKRVEHWTELFEALGQRVTLTIVAADVSEVTRRELRRLSEAGPGVRHRVLPHLFSEDRTGHTASAVFRELSDGLAVDPRPDVLHILGEPSYLSTWQVMRERRRRWPDLPMTTYTAQNIAMRLPFPFPLFERRAFRQADQIFPITPAARDVLRVKGYRGATPIVPLGVDTTRFEPRSAARRAPERAPERFTAGFVGRLERHKGLADLVRAAEVVDCDLLLVGDGGMRADLERAAARRPGRIELYGWADHHELPEVLHRMDVLVLPSVEVVQRNLVPWIGIPLRERFGRVLVEGMACGIPVIGSDVGEIPYVVGNAGLTYPAGDATALADRLAMLRSRPELARDLATEGVVRATTEFSWGRIADSLCRIWADLVDETRSRRRAGRPGRRELERSVTPHQPGPADREAMMP